MGQNSKENLRNRRIVIIVLFALLVSLCAYVFFVPPKGYTFCFIRNTWGVLCSACGGTHCAHFLMRFKFVRAYNENQFLVFALPVFGYLIMAAMINGFFNKKIFPIIKNKYFYISFFILFLGFGILRNFLLI